MVHRVGSLHGSPRVDLAWQVAQMMISTAAYVPWESMFGKARQRVAESKTPAKASRSLNPGPDRPGCIAADETLTVKGHLEGLAVGLGGFGVLRTSKERLETAANGAQQAGDAATSARLRGIAGKLPDVHTPEQAALIAIELDQIVPVVWELGKHCSGVVRQDVMDAASDLAAQVNEGNISREAAVEQLRRVEKSS